MVAWKVPEDGHAIPNTRINGFLIGLQTFRAWKVSRVVLLAHVDLEDN